MNNFIIVITQNALHYSLLHAFGAIYSPLGIHKQYAFETNWDLVDQISLFWSASFWLHIQTSPNRLDFLGKQFD